ncbi:MAG: hypothetical protein ACI8UD_001653, partial [Planctomycetota bacterium]
MTSNDDKQDENHGAAKDDPSKKPQSQKPEKPQKPEKKPKSRLQGEELESRILFSATWIDADTDVAGSGPTNNDDVYLGDGL